ncbi:hypothetical protein [Niveispirillum sp.]|uniref:hypothetical protein n=1 Tax=Niveispirillum sp. TaxID=1917217 RepID=UPI001B654B82|nr:hypothetical protein [Niveispirillum sp.]MBP7336469.1 hypothetical protein [Niveispirillum sp.]
MSLFEKLPIPGDVDWLDFSLSGDFSGKYVCGYSRIADMNGYVVFNIPTYGSSVFLALTEGSPKEVALILANLEDYERENNIDLGLGEVVVTPAGSVRDMPVPFAVILLRTASSPICGDVPDQMVIEGKPTRFLFAMPISEKDHQLRREQGHDALMDVFEAEDRDIVF